VRRGVGGYVWALVICREKGMRVLWNFDGVILVRRILGLCERMANGKWRYMMRIELRRDSDGISLCI